MFIKLPVRLRDGQICFKIVFYSVLRKTLNNYLFAIFFVNFLFVRGWHQWRLSMQCNELQKFEREQHLETQLGLVLRKGPSFRRPSACPSFTCWSYLYFESSCFQQDLLQLSFLKNKQQFTGSFKYYHSLSRFIILQCITMFDTCLFW